MSMREVTADLRNIATPAALQIYLGYVLCAPEWYGCNLDALYDILTEPLVYAAVLSLLLLIALLAVDFVREKKRADERSQTLSAVASDWRSLPEPHSLAEEDYREMG